MDLKAADVSACLQEKDWQDVLKIDAAENGDKNEKNIGD